MLDRDNIVTRILCIEEFDHLGPRLGVCGIYVNLSIVDSS